MLAENIDRWDRRVRAEARRQGRKEGRQEGEARVLLRLLRSKFGPLSRETEKQVRTAGSDRLLEWSERTLTADRLQDVFAD